MKLIKKCVAIRNSYTDKEWIKSRIKDVKCEIWMRTLRMALFSAGSTGPAWWTSLDLSILSEWQSIAEPLVQHL